MKGKMENKIGYKGRFASYMRWPIMLSLLLAVATVIMLWIDYRLGAVMAIVFAIYVAAALLLYFYQRPVIADDVLSFAAQYADIQFEALRHMTGPYGILDENGQVMWANDGLLEVVGENIRDKNIGTYMPEIRGGLSAVEHSQLHIRYKERYYAAMIEELDIETLSEENSVIDFLQAGKRLFAVTLSDETEVVEKRREILDQKLVCGIILVDNYEEVMNSTEEVRQPLLAALIDRKITKYMLQYDAIVNKMEKDRYIFVMRQKYLQTVRSAKFALLDEVREISIGNELNVTLCIGMGVNADTYAQSQEWARHALDLALGRGGDQAVIKDHEKISYYGGKTKQVEKSTRVRARVKAHALRQVMEGKNRIVIMGHQYGDTDCLGAAIGVYRAARELNKRAHIVVNDPPVSVKAMMEPFLENPEYDNAMFINTETAKTLVNMDTALIVVDVNTRDRTEGPALLDLTKTVVVIDHHRQSGQSIENPVLSYIEPYASSACEMVVEILQYIVEKIKLKPEEADALYAGIVIDTNQFKNETGVRTFEAAAFLRKNGADINRVKLKLRDDMRTSKARAEAVNNAIVDSGYAFAVCPAEGVANPSVVGAQAANVLLGISGIEASFVFTPIGDTIFVSARSLDTMNVQLVMERVGGGGHSTVAGAQIKGMTTSEALEHVRTIVKEMKAEGEI